MLHFSSRHRKITKNPTRGFVSLGTIRGRKHPRAVTGFTLVELVVYSGLVALMIFFLGGFVMNVLRLEGETSIKRSLTIVSRGIMNDISLEVRRGKKIYLSTGALGVAAGQLSVETRNGLPEGETAGFIDYYLSESRLFKKYEGQNPVLLSGSEIVSEFRIERFGADTDGEGVKIILTVSGGEGKYENTLTIENSAMFRKN